MDHKLFYENRLKKVNKNASEMLEWTQKLIKSM